MHPLRTRSRAWLVAAAALALSLAACSSDQNNPAGPSGSDFARGGSPGPDLHAAIAAKNNHVDELMRNADVAGVAVGLNEAGKPAVKIYLAHGAARVPTSLDGVPVDVEITGPFSVLPLGKGNKPDKNPHGGGGGGGGSLSPTSRWPRPVPIGISTGNIGECSAGTIGARVTSGTRTYALSNNHVFALENTAAPGSAILQPGRYDTGCNSSQADQIGTLAKFNTISFSKNNTVDAALAEVDPANLGNSTPSGGYGTPSSTTRTATVGMAVEKYGRTTALTHGTVSAVDATVNVQYTSGVATFVNQIIISGGHGAFSKAGDSGSLIVTDDGSHNPVGLLFAGSSRTTIANPINDVLQTMGVTIDGK
ncbi:MAG TPA: hypothetical protein VFL95_00850 [Gemmatimonadales bacterium]|nr:hypothetical protein [Gemmatimonadales bacterium]